MPAAGVRVLGSLAALLVFYLTLSVAPRWALAPVDAAPNADLVVTANQLIAQGQWSDALAPVTALVAAFPGNHIYAEHLATTYNHLGRPREEAEAWELFVATSPNAYEACPRMGNAYLRAHDLAKAIDAAERCLAFDPTDPDLMFHAAHAAEWKDDWVAAEALYRQAAAADPANLDVQIGLGRVALHASEWARAREIADRVIAAGEDADALLLGGLAATGAGQRSDARAYLERGLRVSPNYDDLKTALAALPPVP